MLVARQDAVAKQSALIDNVGIARIMEDVHHARREKEADALRASLLAAMLCDSGALAAHIPYTARLVLRPLLMAPDALAPETVNACLCEILAGLYARSAQEAANEVAALDAQAKSYEMANTAAVRVLRRIVDAVYVDLPHNEVIDDDDDDDDASFVHITSKGVAKHPRVPLRTDVPTVPAATLLRLLTLGRVSRDELVARLERLAAIVMLNARTALARFVADARALEAKGDDATQRAHYFYALFRSTSVDTGDAPLDYDDRTRWPTAPLTLVQELALATEPEERETMARRVAHFLVALHFGEHADALRARLANVFATQLASNGTRLALVLNEAFLRVPADQLHDRVRLARVSETTMIEALESLPSTVTRRIDQTYIDYTPGSPASQCTTDAASLLQAWLATFFRDDRERSAVLVVTSPLAARAEYAVADFIDTHIVKAAAAALPRSDVRIMTMVIPSLATDRIDVASGASDNGHKESDGRDANVAFPAPVAQVAHPLTDADTPAPARRSLKASIAPVAADKLSVVSMTPTRRYAPRPGNQDRFSTKGVSTWRVHDPTPGQDLPAPHGNAYDTVVLVNPNDAAVSSPNYYGVSGKARRVLTVNVILASMSPSLPPDARRRTLSQQATTPAIPGWPSNQSVVAWFSSSSLRGNAHLYPNVIASPAALGKDALDEKKSRGAFGLWYKRVPNGVTADEAAGWVELADVETSAVDVTTDATETAETLVVLGTGSGTGMRWFYEPSTYANDAALAAYQKRIAAALPVEVGAGFCPPSVDTGAPDDLEYLFRCATAALHRAYAEAGAGTASQYFDVLTRVVTAWRTSTILPTAGRVRDLLADQRESATPLILRRTADMGNGVVESIFALAGALRETLDSDSVVPAFTAVERAAVRTWNDRRGLLVVLDDDDDVLHALAKYLTGRDASVFSSVIDTPRINTHIQTAAEMGGWPSVYLLTSEHLLDAASLAGRVHLRKSTGVMLINARALLASYYPTMSVGDLKASLREHPVDACLLSEMHARRAADGYEGGIELLYLQPHWAQRHVPTTLVGVIGTLVGVPSQRTLFSSAALYEPIVAAFGRTGCAPDEVTGNGLPQRLIEAIGRHCQRAVFGNDTTQ